MYDSQVSTSLAGFGICHSYLLYINVVYALVRVQLQRHVDSLFPAVLRPCVEQCGLNIVHVNPRCACRMNGIETHKEDVKSCRIAVSVGDGCGCDKMDVTSWVPTTVLKYINNIEANRKF